MCSMAAMTRPAADGLRSASQAWMAARSATALREKRTLATVTGEELPNRMLRRRVQRLLVPALQLGQLLLGEVRWGRVARDTGGDQVGEPVLIRGRRRGAGFVED